MFCRLKYIFLFSSLGPHPHPSSFTRLYALSDSTQFCALSWMKTDKLPSILVLFETELLILNFSGELIS